MFQVLIVGGGSAGWLVAASLKAAFKGRVTVTLIEPKNLPKVGVGESTLPTIINTLKRIGCLDRDFLNAVGATFKQGIKFSDWKDLGHTFYHPYDYKPTPKYQNLDAWLSQGAEVPFAEIVTPQVAAMEANLGPFQNADGTVRPHFRYSLHVDAELLSAEIKRRWTKDNAVVCVEGEVAAAVYNDEWLTKIRLTSGQEFTADLFIDCTGQARVLSQSIEYKNYTHLPVDRALAVRPQYMDAVVPSFTHCTALSSGWIWDIPLQSRRGVGYVYSSAHCDADAALTSLQHYLGTDALEVRSLKFEPGVLREPWRANVVSIGLSAGFVEPLESTGIYFIEEAINLLIAFFPFSGQAHARAKFNQELVGRYDECADFVFLHYFLSNRRDSTFWRQVTDQSAAPCNVAAALDFWDSLPPAADQFLSLRQVFAHIAYEYILYGMHWLPRSYEPSGFAKVSSRRNDLRGLNLLPSRSLWAQSQ
jgi:tryptophan halogenase